MQNTENEAALAIADGHSAAQTAGQNDVPVPLGDVAEYWDSHLNATQFLHGREVEVGSAEFFDSIQQEYSRFSYKSELFDEVAATSGGRLLEIGCGLGCDLVELANRGVDVTAIDLSPRAVSLCQRHLAHRDLKGEVQVANCEALPFADDSFDTVYSSGVIQHTPGIEAAVSEIFRVLRPGGKLVVVLYHRYSWFNLLKWMSGKNVEFEDAEAPIVRTFSRGDLRRLFRAAAEVDIRMEHFRPQPTPRPGTLSQLFNRVFVPLYGSLPEMVIRRYGWHAVVTATKGK